MVSVMDVLSFLATGHCFVFSFSDLLYCGGSIHSSSSSTLFLISAAQLHDAYYAFSTTELPFFHFSRLTEDLVQEKIIVRFDVIWRRHS